MGFLDAVVVIVSISLSLQSCELVFMGTASSVPLGFLGSLVALAMVSTLGS